MSDRILLFIPCFNCAAQIGRVIAQSGDLPDGPIAEVLVLDNGSTDGTLARAEEAVVRRIGPPITVARNRRNHHLGGSHKAAFAYAVRGGFSHVLVLHGDDQARLSDIAPLLAAGEHRRHDACLGARFAPGARLKGYSRLRTVGNRAFNTIFSVVARHRILDLGSGLNIFARSAFADPAVARASDDLRFNVFLLLRMIDRGLSLRFFPISWREEDQLSNVRLVSQAWATLAIAWEYAARRRRFREHDHRDAPVEEYAFDIIARHRAPIVA